MPIATIAEARDEIMTHFQTAWDAGTPPIPLVMYDDRHTDPPEDAPFARVTIQHVPFEQVTVGGRVSQGGAGMRFRRFGIVTIQIFTISDDGLTDSDTLVQLVLDAFEGESTGSDRIEFRNVRDQEIGQDGPWFQTNVVAEFNYDRVKT